MYFPGDTITHRFVIPFGSSEINCVIISYKQNGSIILEKTVTSGFENEGRNVSSFSVVFTQEEGLLFADNDPFTIQCNVYTTSGTRHTSYEIMSKNKVGTQYHREVISYG